VGETASGVNIVFVCYPIYTIKQSSSKHRADIDQMSSKHQAIRAQVEHVYFEYILLDVSLMIA